METYTNMYCIATQITAGTGSHDIKSNDTGNIYHKLVVDKRCIACTHTLDRTTQA